MSSKKGEIYEIIQLIPVYTQIGLGEYILETSKSTYIKVVFFSCAPTLPMIQRENEHERRLTP